jgi:hypothetical protein
MTLRHNRFRSGSCLAASPSACAPLIPPPRAHADTVANLMNATARPCCNFASTDDPVVCGDWIRNEFAACNGNANFQTVDEHQASYLITQAVSELCPERVQQLRNSAASYRSSSSRRRNEGRPPP